jgi:uncharacterized protein (DUF362 family)
MKPSINLLSDPRVAAIKLPSAEYVGVSGNIDQVSAALERTGAELGWSEEERGPFGKVIPSGSRVLIKPNWVIHENHGPWGLEPLVTHASLVRAAVEQALRAGPSEVRVGDAPLQSCDFDQLMSATGIDTWASRLASVEPRFKGIRDFRRTTCRVADGVRVAAENLQSLDNFVLFDLGRDSLLEPITDGSKAFRVTSYDPRLMARTHAPGRHQYLVAKDVFDADVVINLPKLKTHKKAGVTCALKNLIGINGNKEYLPHHRLGGTQGGGDCYPGDSAVKRALEYAHDQRNTTRSVAMSRFWHGLTLPLNRMLHMKGDQLGIEGAWSGNDTIWRTCLDLNRILLYGRPDGTVADEPVRRVVHIVDAIVAGQGDGPLSPQPLPMGLIFAGANPVAVDWVGAQLLGYDPELIPIIHEAFKRFQWPLTTFTQGEVTLVGDLGAGVAAELLRLREVPADLKYPAGWRDAVRAHATA